MVRRLTARTLPHVEAAREALSAGFEAFVRGEPLSANAHDPARCPATYAAWRAGWLQAESAMKRADTLNRAA